MKISLCDVDFNNEIKFEDGYVVSLECESIDYFIKLVNNAKGLNYNAFNIIDGNTNIDLQKDAITVIDYFSLEQQEKTILTKFYKTLDKRFIADIEVVKKLNEIAKVYESLCNYITEDYNVNFEINMPTTISEYVKFADLKVKGGFSVGVEGLLNFINILSILKTHKLLILVNSKSFFNSAQLSEIIKCCVYNNIKTLFIDAKTNKNHYKNEIKLLIDSDYYDILYK